MRTVAGGSFVAVGTVLSEIEIWNLDVMDAVEPVCVLGGTPLQPAPPSLPLLACITSAALLFAPLVVPSAPLPCSAQLQ